MMTKHSWTLDELAAWAGTPGFQPLWDRVHLSPHAKLWPRESHLQECISFLINALPPDKRPLLQAVCLAGLALTENPDPEIVSTLQTWFTPAAIGLPFSWTEFTNLTWQRLPLLLADENTDKAFVVWALAGKGSRKTSEILPVWATTCMDIQAQGAVRLAADFENMKAGTGFFFWPFLDFTQSKIQIRGSSLGLPALLGFYAVSHNLTVPGLAATGCLDSIGRLLPVSHLEAKIRAADAAHMRGLIFPCPADTRNLPWSTSYLELLPVSELPTAKSLWRLYAPGQGAVITQVLHSQNTPRKVVTGLLCLSEDITQHIEREYGLIRKTIRSVINASDIQGLGQILDLLCPSDDEQLANQALIQAALDSIRAKDMDTIYLQSPELCLRICRLQLMRCRHQGRLTAWDKWKAWLEEHQLEKEILCLDQGESKLLMLLAERIVQDQHNSFCFDPTLLSKLGPWFQRALKDEEERFERRVQSGGPCVHRALGCLYGTMAQHFGFCGPAYLDLCLDYVHLAQKAFGQGQRADFRQDWLREFSYLVYAYLDVGMMQKARESLEAYLETPNLEQFEPQTTNPFQHAAYVRFLADSGHLLPQAYADYWSFRLGQIPNQHPWQLWAVNFGRLMPDMARKKACWETAVTICKEIPGETTKAMLLLPLSFLDGYGLATRTWLEEETGIAVNTIRSSLHVGHFDPILNASDWENILFHTRSHLPSMFPFSYR